MHYKIIFISQQLEIYYNCLFLDDILIKIDIPKIPATFTGSGDLFAALFLAHIHLQNNIKTTMEKTVNTLYNVLLNTYEYSKSKLLYFIYICINLYKI